METKKYKTKTLLFERDNPTKDVWNIGLDIGYSAVKGFSPNNLFCFPAFAKKQGDVVSVAKADSTDIQYRNSTGEVWNVGESAQNMSSTNDSELAVFGRTRYFSEMYRVISEVGMAFGMLKNKFGDPSGKEIYIQTGLPPEYRKSDTPDLIEVLSGEHEFDIRIGERDWIHFKFTIASDHVGVIDQPMGTLFSISTNPTGRPAKEARKYFSSNLIIIDAGFGTLDIYNIANGKIITKPETVDNMGMKQVFKQTIRDIMDKYKKELTIMDMQKVLLSGEIHVFEKKNGRPVSKKVSVANILEKNSKEVCEAAIARICNTYNNLVDHDYLIITGGTCAAWKDYIKEYFNDMETLEILSGAQNDNLSAVFANVRGYYMYALNRK